jgi:predicted nucleic acid-binding protein
VSNPTATPVNDECNQWMRGLLARGIRVVLPEIADYEVRRELLRARKTTGIAELDQLKTTLEYAPLTTAAMLMAAEFWAEARRRGRPTTDPHALDGDVILAGQTVTLTAPDEQRVVATTNPRHLAQFVDARDWRGIS